MWFDDGQVPLLFEALPTEAKATEAQQDFHLDLLRPLRTLGVSAVNVPEIIGGHYETVPPTDFATGIQATTGLPTIVNRITVQEPAAGLQAWLDATRSQGGIDHVVLVGGESSSESYPGPSVTEGIRIASASRAEGQTIGCITIPTRRRPGNDEPDRLIAKQNAGADFAISQILGESVSAATLQHDLALASRASDVPCLPLFWSLSPVSRPRDIGFLKWLGVEIPAAYEKRLRGATSVAQRVNISHETNESMARNLLEHAEAKEHGPIGFCIEHVMRSNMAPAFDLVERVADVTREFKGAPLPRSR